MKYRHRVLGLLCLLSLITYLDRICISVAGPRMQRELNIGPAEWGWVVGAFALAYGLFEVPTGLWGDRVGARVPLTRIVAWWSVFTALTGVVSGLRPLILVRFLFGAGEAGAYPIASSAISRWFPVEARARAFGLMWMSSQFGGAAAPLLVVPLQLRYGWRASFFIFGAAGILWSLVWFFWYRDRAPGAAPSPAHTRANWRDLLRQSNVRTVMAIGFCYVYAQYFFIAWLHTFLVVGRGFSETDLYFTSAPFLLGAATNLLGGVASDRAVSRLGPKWGRRVVGFSGLTVSALALTAAAFVQDKPTLLLLLALSYAGTTFQQPSVWAACVDIGGPQAGTVSALMNTAAQIGSFVLSISYGQLAAGTGSYNLALIPIVAALLTGAALWLRVDSASKRNSLPPDS